MLILPLCTLKGISASTRNLLELTHFTGQYLSIFSYLNQIDLIKFMGFDLYLNLFKLIKINLNYEIPKLSKKLEIWN